MKIGNLIQEAFKNLLSNKTRSLLTMLGIFIGVGAVIAMMSVGFGVKDSITQEFNALGTNTMNVFQGNFSEQVRNPKPLTNEDVKKVAALDVVEKTSAFLGGAMQISRPGKKTTSMMVYGMEPTYFSINNIKIAEGRNLNEEDLRKNDAVIVIGSEVKKLMFGEDSSVLGESLRINGQPFTIVGVMESLGKPGVGMNIDQTIIPPLTTVQTRLLPAQRSEVTEFILVFYPTATSSEVEKQVSAVLSEAHQIRAGDPNDFTVMNMQAYMDTMNNVMSTFVIFLGGVAGISLLVGGIGIMNIMLVTVSERTREIGLRKAVGAKNRDVLVQFLIESSVLSFVGGILGILFGILLGFGITRIATNMGTPLNLSINPVLILGVTLFSILVGLFFGIYPARRAANLEPVIALRTD